MCSLVTSAAPVNYENKDDIINNTQGIGTQKKSQTYKNKDTNRKIKKEMIADSWSEPDDVSDDESSKLADFKPVQANLQNKNLYMNSHNQKQNSADDKPVIGSEGFSQLESTYAPDYYKQYNSHQGSSTPDLYQGSYVAPQPSIDSNSELLKKIDNILHLLEEQQEEKTNLITEELILYVFLGIFVIYVLDSFVRVGKYVR